MTAAPPSSAPEPTRLRVDIAYDGSAFSGWAKQPGMRTVQGVLEESIDRLFGFRLPPVRLVVAGRTDAGVHAHGQVTHIDLSAQHVAMLRRPRAGHEGESLAERLARKVNGALGLYSDVVITRAAEAPVGFDARFSAIWRRYEYRIADRLSRHEPLDRARTSWVTSSLEIDAMNAASDRLLGLHDFLAFCKPRVGATTIRTLQEFRWARLEDGVVRAELRADAFCHSMVRALVGAVVAVGAGKASADDVEAALRERAARGRLAPVMPARGLSLVEVAYPPADELARQAELSRARRQLSVAVDDVSGADDTA